MVVCGSLASDHSKSSSQESLVIMKSFTWPRTHTFQQGSNSLGIAVVMDAVFHRNFTVSEGRDVIGEILGGGHPKNDRAKAARLRIDEAR